MKVSTLDKDFILAANAADANNYKDIDSEAIRAEMTTLMNVDNLIDQQSLFRRLSIEAQQLIKVIFDCPKEFLEIACTPKEKKICKTGVEKYSKLIHGKKKGIKIFREVGKFVKQTI